MGPPQKDQLGRRAQTTGRTWEGGPGYSPEGPDGKEGPNWEGLLEGLGREGPDCWASRQYALEKRLSCLYV